MTLKSNWITGDSFAATDANAVASAVNALASSLQNVVEDTTPQLGGNLDVQSFTVGAATAADLTKLHAITASAATLNAQSGTNTGDQTSVTGNAGTATALATARGIDGQSFDGTASITVVAPGTHAATSKTTPVDADEFPVVDSAASNVLKKVTFANLKTWVKTYYDSVTSTMTNKTLTLPTITGYTESVVAIGTVTSSSTISLTNGTLQTATLTASTACTFTMPTATAGTSFTLLLKQAAATGNGTATFTSVKWGSGGTPVVTATAGKMDIFTFVADGASWYGSVAQGYTP